jgi:hypothetical protein
VFVSGVSAVLIKYLLVCFETVKIHFHVSILFLYSWTSFIISLQMIAYGLLCDKGDSNKFAKRRCRVIFI